jgi:hypothetical protein
MKPMNKFQVGDAVKRETLVGVVTWICIHSKQVTMIRFIDGVDPVIFHASASELEHYTGPFVRGERLSAGLMHNVEFIALDSYGDYAGIVTLDGTIALVETRVLSRRKRSRKVTMQAWRGLDGKLYCTEPGVMPLRDLIGETFEIEVPE